MILNVLACWPGLLPGFWSMQGTVRILRNTPSNIPNQIQGTVWGVVMNPMTYEWAHHGALVADAHGTEGAAVHCILERPLVAELEQQPRLL